MDLFTGNHKGHQENDLTKILIHVHFLFLFFFLFFLFSSSLNYRNKTGSFRFKHQVGSIVKLVIFNEIFLCVLINFAVVQKLIHCERCQILLAISTGTKVC